MVQTGSTFEVIGLGDGKILDLVQLSLFMTATPPYDTPDRSRGLFRVRMLRPWPWSRFSALVSNLHPSVNQVSVTTAMVKAR